MRLKFEELMMTKDWCHLGGKISHDLIIALGLIWASLLHLLYQALPSLRDCFENSILAKQMNDGIYFVG
jgi:hypothetical protein